MTKKITKIKLSSIDIPKDTRNQSSTVSLDNIKFISKRRDNINYKYYSSYIKMLIQMHQPRESEIDFNAIDFNSTNEEFKVLKNHQYTEDNQINFSQALPTKQIPKNDKVISNHGIYELIIRFIYFTR